MAELDVTNIASTSISTPASGVTAIFVDTDKRLKTKDDAGVINGFPKTNFSVASQAPAATTRTYITGSSIAVPPSKLQVGSCFQWKFHMTKTGAGTATSTIDIAVGTAGTTADTARVSFTKPAGTAAIDDGLVTVDAIVRTIGATGVMVGLFTLVHNLQITGHAIIPCVVVNTISSGFDMTVANLIVGLCITTGASDAITIQMVTAQAWNL